MSNTFFRFEFKYPILARDIKALEWDISRMGMREDMNGIAYPVSSLYFDTPELSDYNDKSGGFLKRRKIRARTYRGCEELSLKGDESKVWLEIKDKYNMFVMKRRVALSAEEWLYFSKRFRIGQELYSRLDLKEKKIFDEFRFHVLRANRRPHLVVSYMRKAYVHKVGGQMMRVTFDYNLQAAKSQTLHDKKVFTPVMPGRAVMEVKYDNFLPAFMRYIIQKYNIRRDAYSKYALSVDATRKFHKPER